MQTIDKGTDEATNKAQKQKPTDQEVSGYHPLIYFASLIETNLGFIMGRYCFRS